MLPLTLPDRGYFRNSLYALHVIHVSTFLLLIRVNYYLCYVYNCVHITYKVKTKT